MKTFNVAIVGGGPGCLAIMDMISQDRFRQLQMHLVGVADNNSAAPALLRAQALGIYTTHDYRHLFALPHLDLIIELTGNAALSQVIENEKPDHVQFMNHVVARLFWDFIRLEEEKITSEKKYRDLFDHAREGLVLFDDDGRIVESNLSMAYMLGYPKEALEKMRLYDMAATFSKKILRDHLNGLKILGFAATEMDFVKQNNDLLPVEANITWLPDDNLFRIMVRDITLQKKLEESRRLYSERLEQEVEERTLALRDSEEEARTQQKTAEGIIYGSPIPMFVLNKDHKITYWNKACEKLTGFRSEEMIGTDRHWEPFFPRKRPLMADLIVDGELDTLRELYKDMQLRESPVVEGAFEAEHYFPSLGPEGTHLYFNAAPIKDDAGNIQGTIVTYQDFSERVRMTQEIKRREAFVQNLIQNSIDGIIATDENGQILIFNRGAAEILDYSPEEVIGRMTYEEILPHHAAASIREAFDSHLHGPRGKIINLEVRLLDKAQEPIPARVSGTLLFEEHREVGTVLFVEDLREIYRLEKEKEQAQRMAAIGQAVAGLAHYIKNILTGLKGGSYVMNSAMDKADLDLVRKGWQMVEGNIDQIGMIVTDMLIYSSQRIPKYEPIDPNKLVTEVLELMEGRAKTAGVQLTWDLQQDLRDVRMDRTAIHRCLLNLVSNAIDACTLEGIVDGSGMVKVKTARQMDGSIRFEISDNGTGMDAATQEKLFTDFFTTKGYKGTGLGLPVTQKIVEEHGGELTFQSRLGEGTTFTMVLPG